MDVGAAADPEPESITAWEVAPAAAEAGAEVEAEGLCESLMRVDVTAGVTEECGVLVSPCCAVEL
jgi:hypothetical protein